jgi:uncharacterized protein YndB with AHSA1/START domain
VTRICKSIRIQTPVEEVFEYVTTPGTWPAWHPSSLGVDGATNHSLEPGEQVTEEYSVAGRRGRVVWTVREREAPRRWVIGPAGATGRISPLRSVNMAIQWTPSPQIFLIGGTSLIISRN